MQRGKDASAEIEQIMDLQIMTSMKEYEFTRALLKNYKNADGIKESDFYDGVHCTSEALEKFFHGIWQALEEADKGITPHVLSLKNRTTAAERISW